MVLLLERFNKLYSKLESHRHHHRHHHESEALLASYLQAFESEVSSCLNQLPSSPDPGSRFLSFSWILQLFQVLPIVHQAFAKLVANMEFPVGKWGEDLVDGYLSYSLNLLDLFNSISFSLSQLGRSRLLRSHALSLVESSPSSAIERLKPVVPQGFKRDFKAKETGNDQKKGPRAGKEWVIQQALVMMEAIGYWVCGTVLSGCEGDSKAYLEMRKSAGDLIVSSFKRLDSSIFKAVAGENGSVVKEVTELNDAAAQLVAALVAGESSGGAAEEMRRKLVSLEKQAERLEKEVNSQFSEVLAGRSQLLDIFRQQKH